MLHNFAVLFFFYKFRSTNFLYLFSKGIKVSLIQSFILWCLMFIERKLFNKYVNIFEWCSYNFFSGSPQVFVSVFLVFVRSVSDNISDVRISSGEPVSSKQPEGIPDVD